ncbi:unnamed protein product [Rotaria sordida]|uniref:NHL repeat-containing protein n=1 Tax=Rotaria sordida TaxID=392033 RepID=A0A813ZVS8_9BILA|nr:unnamed protein product [Rotaria sordida]CAF0910957.1 unnamed protein product [Rotaria sordida]CAF3701529.1 unnamed protein product [Rotaria sordida]CAF3868449.1 unnamed protein product [Rotaria sordida]
MSPRIVKVSSRRYHSHRLRLSSSHYTLPREIPSSNSIRISSRSSNRIRPIDHRLIDSTNAAKCINNINEKSTVIREGNTYEHATAPLFLRWNSTGITVAGISGVSGPAANQLNHPWGLGFDSSYALYIADRINNRVQKWDINASTGTTVAGQANATGGSTLYHLNQPTFIQFDSSDNIYVTDVGNHRVQFWHYGARSGSTICGTGIAGNSTNQLNQPFGIARDPITKTLYVADYENHRIMQYQWGQLSGTVVAGGNGPGTNRTQLYRPVTVHFDSSSNSLIIVNYDAHNVVRWILGASSWTLVAGSINGTSGNSSTLLSNPIGVMLDPMKNVYVIDRNNHRVQLFLTDQLNGITIAGVTGLNGSNATLLYYPYAVIFDAELNLYVADRYNHRVQKFLRY